MSQNYWNSYVKRAGETLLVICADGNQQVFKTSLADQEVQAETMDQMADMIKALLPRTQFSMAQKNKIRESANYLSEQYGGMKPEQFIDVKLEERLN